MDSEARASHTDARGRRESPATDATVPLFGRRLRPFAIERFYERWEFTTERMLSSSDCEARTVEELLRLGPDADERLHRLALGYTEVRGSAELLDAVASLYSRAEPRDVMSTAAAEEGIFLAVQSLLGPGEHAVVEFPSYGSAAELARSTGAEVSLWRRKFEDGWSYDLDRLEGLLTSRTRFLYINSPHNPTGTQMPRAVFDHVVELARERGLVLLCDEVYRGLEHDPAARLPAVCDVYERGLSLGAVSKAHGLPGLRTAWVACRDRSVLGRLLDLKLYTTICSSAPSELLLALALRHADSLIERSRVLMLQNLALLAEFMERHSDMFEWVPPSAGPIGFPRMLGVSDVSGWCERLAAQEGVLLLPGEVYGLPAHVRFGFGRRDLPLALERLEHELSRGAPSGRA